jgi:hypothetical protein
VARGEITGGSDLSLHPDIARVLKFCVDFAFLTWRRKGYFKRFCDWEILFVALLLILIVLPSSFEILSLLCFHRPHIKTIKFDSDSQLFRSEEFCFYMCFLTSKLIPCWVQFLAFSCFALATINLLRIENDVTLKQIDRSCFGDCLLEFRKMPDMNGHSRSIRLFIRHITDHLNPARSSHGNKIASVQALGCKR